MGRSSGRHPTVVIGGITASPFPMGDDQSPPNEPREAWWPALFAPDLINPMHATVLCPCWPGNGSTWQGFDEEPSPAISVGACRLDRGLARWLRVHDADYSLAPASVA